MFDRSCKIIGLWLDSGCPELVLTMVKDTRLEFTNVDDVAGTGSSRSIGVLAELPSFGALFKLLGFGSSSEHPGVHA